MLGDGGVLSRETGSSLDAARRGRAVLATRRERVTGRDGGEQRRSREDAAGRPRHRNRADPVDEATRQQRRQIHRADVQADDEPDVREVLMVRLQVDRARRRARKPAAWPATRSVGTALH